VNRAGQGFQPDVPLAGVDGWTRLGTLTLAATYRVRVKDWCGELAVVPSGGPGSAPRNGMPSDDGRPVAVGPAWSGLVWSSGEAMLLGRCRALTTAGYASNGLVDGQATPRILVQLDKRLTQECTVRTVSWGFGAAFAGTPYGGAAINAGAARLGAPPNGLTKMQAHWSNATVTLTVRDIVSGAALHTTATANSHALVVPVWAEVFAVSTAPANGAITWESPA